MNKVATLCLLVFLAVFATACNDSVSLDQLSRHPSKLVVYAFPTEGDTIDITISATYPISGKMPTLDVQTVSCTTNGTADRIVFLGDTIVGGGIPVSRFAA